MRSRLTSQTLPSSSLTLRDSGSSLTTSALCIVRSGTHGLGSGSRRSGIVSRGSVGASDSGGRLAGELGDGPVAGRALEGEHAVVHRARAQGRVRAEGAPPRGRPSGADGRGSHTWSRPYRPRLGPWLGPSGRLCGHSLVVAREAVVGDRLPRRGVGDELVRRRPHAGVAVERRRGARSRPRRSPGCGRAPPSRTRRRRPSRSRRRGAHARRCSSPAVTRERAGLEPGGGGRAGAGAVLAAGAVAVGGRDERGRDLEADGAAAAAAGEGEGGLGHGAIVCAGFVSDRRAVGYRSTCRRNRYLGGRMDLGRTALRLIIGPLFVGHGTQKLFGWFGGHGLDGTGALLRASSASGPASATPPRPARPRPVGGALLTLGALTPVAAGLDHRHDDHRHPQGPRARRARGSPNGGYEYNLTMIAAMLALTEAGPGRPSVDAAVFPRLKGNGWRWPSSPPRPPASTLLTVRAHEPAVEEARARGATSQAERQNRFAREDARGPRPTRYGPPHPRSGGARVGRRRARSILVPSCATDRTPPPQRPPDSRPRSCQLDPRGLSRLRHRLRQPGRVDRDRGPLVVDAPALRAVRAQPRGHRLQRRGRALRRGAGLAAPTRSPAPSASSTSSA